MTSRLDEDGLHPLVSSLLEGRSISTNSSAIKTYNRETMMKLMTSELSMKRPDNLSEEFNGEDGKFSPLKWLEHRWEVEGVKNRPISKNIDSLCAGAHDNTGLSPQRRAFSGGCRAPADGEKGKEGDASERDGHTKNWRNGNGGSDKFSKGNDFKLPFQKGGFERGNRNEWKRNEKESRTGNKFGINRREDRGGSVSGSEKLPEWADGPTTMDDMIELRGFEEPKKGKKKNVKDTKKERDNTTPSATQDATASNACASRPSSAGLSNKKGNLETIADSAIASAEIAYSSTGGGVLPESDQELAALLGVLDNSVTVKKEQSDETIPVGGSRLSRFFGNKQSKSPEHEGATNDENVANPVMAKILGHTPSGGQTPNGLAALNLTNVKAGMRLEDIEKGFSNYERRNSGGKGSFLQDPSQQAELLLQLRDVAKQNAERQGSPPSNVGQHQPQIPHHHAQGNLPHPNMNIPLMADPALLASFAQNPVLLNAHVEGQLHQAIAAATRANNGQPITQQLHEQLRIAAMRNKMFLQQQTLAFAQFSQQHQHQQQLNQQKNRGIIPSMIPSSVQRQLHKEKKEKSGHMPHEQPEQTSSDSQADFAAHVKKMQMQQNYATLVNSMNMGLGMSSYRQNQPMPQNLEMILAQHRANYAHQTQRMMNKHQRDVMLAQLMQMHSNNQQVPQQKIHFNATARAAPQQTAVPSELSGVGPIQTPLEKLLASVGVQASQFRGPTPADSRLPSSAKPLSLEELEKELMAQQK